MDNKLCENKDVRQRPGEGYRRWFLNNYFDIIVWYEKKDGDIKGFQICYEKNGREKAFTWEPKAVSSHYVSTSGFDKSESSFDSAILMGHAGKIPGEVIDKLNSDQGELDSDLLNNFIEKITSYNKKLGNDN